MVELLFDDIFKVKCVNPDGQKYDKGTLIFWFLKLSIYALSWLAVNDSRWVAIDCINLFLLVSRIDARSEKLAMHMLLDVNTEIYPIDEGEKILMVLSPTLNYDGAPVASHSSQVIFSPLIFKKTTYRN